MIALLHHDSVAEHYLVAALVILLVALVVGLVASWLRKGRTL